MPNINNCGYRRMESMEADTCEDLQDHSHDCNQHSKTRMGLTKRSLGGIGWIITTTLLIAILWILAHPSHSYTLHTSVMDNASPYTDTSSPYSEKWANCGSTPTEAKSRGCKFDILSFAWQLPECYDDKIMQEFLAEKDWTFFRHENGTSPVSREVALLGELDLYVTQEYHQVHCMYMWRQMHRAFTIQKHIDSHLNNYYHTVHCHHVMLGNQFPPESIGAIGELKYPTCQRLS
jgi:hypothetical protein